MNDLGALCRNRWEFPANCVRYAALEPQDDEKRFPGAEYCISRRMGDGMWCALLILEIDSSGGDVKAYTYIPLAVRLETSVVRVTIDTEHELPTGPSEARRAAYEAACLGEIEAKLKAMIASHRTGEDTKSGRRIGFDIKMTETSTK